MGCLLYKLMFFTLPFGESILAIQNGTFYIPDSSQYSSSLHKLVKYMLEPNQELRPNIWQVCEIAFKLQSKENPVINIQVSYFYFLVRFWRYYYYYCLKKNLMNLFFLHRNLILLY